MFNSALAAGLKAASRRVGRHRPPRRLQARRPTCSHPADGKRTARLAPARSPTQHEPVRRPGHTRRGMECRGIPSGSWIGRSSAAPIARAVGRRRPFSGRCEPMPDIDHSEPFAVVNPRDHAGSAGQVGGQYRRQLRQIVARGSPTKCRVVLVIDFDPHGRYSIVIHRCPGYSLLDTTERGRCATNQGPIYDRK
jgi:hypothetical protein